MGNENRVNEFKQIETFNAQEIEVSVAKLATRAYGLFWRVVSDRFLFELTKLPQVRQRAASDQQEHLNQLAEYPGRGADSACLMQVVEQGGPACRTRLPVRCTRRSVRGLGRDGFCRYRKVRRPDFQIKAK